MSTSLPSSEDLRAALARDGFVLIPQVIRGEELGRYRAAARSATDLARAGQWPYIRTLPKQFPPWSSDPSNGIWGVQHLLHPDQPFRDIFAESYFHPSLLKAITSLLQCSEADLVLELYNMLVRPDADFALRWHRDDIPPDVDPELEETRLREPMVHAQWNLSLYDDASLVVVPGSHRRARTSMERNADPYEDDMPGQRIVRMAPGDIMFYNNNILHRGVYDNKVERMTLHGTMGLAGPKDRARARNILQHGIGQWAERAMWDGLEEDTRALAMAMQSRLIEMGKGEDVGYSQVN